MRHYHEVKQDKVEEDASLVRNIQIANPCLHKGDCHIRLLLWLLHRLGDGARLEQHEQIHFPFPLGLERSDNLPNTNVTSARVGYGWELGQYMERHHVLCT